MQKTRKDSTDQRTLRAVNRGSFLARGGGGFGHLACQDRCECLHNVHIRALVWRARRAADRSQAAPHTRQCTHQASESPAALLCCLAFTLKRSFIRDCYRVDRTFGLGRLLVSCVMVSHIRYRFIGNSPHESESESIAGQPSQHAVQPSGCTTPLLKSRTCRLRVYGAAVTLYANHIHNRYNYFILNFLTK